MGIDRLIILGFGGTSRDVLDVFNDSEGRDIAGRRHELECFLDDDSRVHGRTYRGISVKGKLTDAEQIEKSSFLFTIGSPSNHRRRESILEKLSIAPARFPSFVHPTATVSPSATIGHGCVIFPYVYLGSNAVIGDHVLILAHSVVSHDSELGSFSLVAANASLSGGVTVGRSCYVGTSASIRGGTSVGDGAMIGMGAVVVKNVVGGTTVAGNPAGRLDARGSVP